jgi:citrate/tricarballylate utilization protein
MPGAELPVIGSEAWLADAQRQLEVCNACRYCEGVCAVFPALERRTAFAEGDIAFLANLCHDCRSCLYVCPYAPPHEFGVNIPLLMASARDESYRRYAWHRRLGDWLGRHQESLIWVLLASVVAVVAASLVAAGPAGLITTHTGPGAFYNVFPWWWMFAPAMLLSIYGIVAVGVGLRRFWRETAGRHRSTSLREIMGGLEDAMALRYMDGGGPGCDYPDEVPSKARKWFHHLVFWGFLAAFASTTSAFIAQEILGILPPYPYLSIPVVLGTVGGVAMIVGSFGFLRLKERADPEPAYPPAQAFDRRFLFVLIALNATGLVLLAFRGTPAMGLLLDAHLALVFAFLITAPYGKLVHGVYRYAALVLDRVEARAEAREAEERAAAERAAA